MMNNDTFVEKLTAFECKNFEEDDLRGLAIIGETIREVDFSYADLRDCEFKYCNFIDCYFTNSDLRGVQFNSCNIINTNLHGADCRNTNMKQTSMINCKIFDETIKDITFWFSDIDGKDPNDKK